MKKTYLYTIALLSLGLSLNAATLEMANGDKLSGIIKSQDDKSIVLETPYASLTVEKSKVKEIIDEATPAKEEVAQAPAPAPKKEEKKDNTPDWIQEYKDSINPYMGGWEVKLKAAFEHKKTNSSYTAYNISGEAFKQITDLSSIKLNAYYDYTTETPVDGAAYTSTDKYGLGSLYRYDFSKDTNWYISNELNYRRDEIKEIQNEVNEIVAIGYTLKYFEDDLVINLYGGPGIKYIDATGYDTPWVAILSVGEEVKWKFHDYMRLEHKMDFQLNLENTDQYFFYFMVGLAVSPSPVFDIVLRYSYQYDGINSSDSLKNETRFLLGIEVPLGWK